MFPVCSATSCSSFSQILLNDGFRYLPRSQKALDVTVGWLPGDFSVPKSSSGLSPVSCLQREPASSLYTEFLGSNKSLSNEWPYSTGKIRDSFFLGGNHVIYVDDSAAAVSVEENVGETLLDNADTLIDSTSKATASVLDTFTDGAAAPDASSINIESWQTSSNNFEDVSSQANDSISSIVNKGGNALNSSLEKTTSTIADIIKDGNEAFEKLTYKVLSSVDQTGELTRSKLSSLPNNLKEASNEAGGAALQLLRKAILMAEDSLVKGGKLIHYAYEASKDSLPPEIQNALGSFETKTNEISRPVTMIFLQVYSAIEGLERNLGLDPTDPIVPFVLFLSATSTIWTIYWVVTYSGYAGDLSPKLAFELLKGKEKAVLIDVRPEDLKQRDGIPDLRRTARFRYADVSLLKVDGSLRKLIKSSKDLDDSLIASVIRNLKIVQDRSKVIIMDADGSRAKGIARSLRNLGTKRPYVLQGGFQSWVKEGLRVKELKPETAITILNEEAEAILEELSPSPLQLLGIGVGSIAALYALIEWEKSLQLIGLVGIAQTIFRRVASYEDSEDFRKDVSSLLSPVAYGAQALTWTAGKVDTNGNGLPLMPSSSDVQSRVLQAAAKHESQPTEGPQDSAMDSSTSVDENADPSEA